MSAEPSRVLVVTQWRDQDEIRVRLVAADEPMANPITMSVEGALKWFQSWLELGTS